MPSLDPTRVSAISDPSSGALPSLGTLHAFLRARIPPRARDVPFLYHAPRPSAPVPSPSSHVVLAITPTTPGFYASLSSSSSSAAFLHRPWSLDRRRVPRRAAVLASHTGFDAALTVGHNPVLAARLGVVVLAAVVREFGAPLERAVGFDAPDAADDDEGGTGPETMIEVVAIMNAFRPDEVERVAKAAAQALRDPSNTTTSEEEGEEERDDDDDDDDDSCCRNVLYLTGAVREPGLQAARDRQMAVVCVGHRVCEEWGIRYLGELLKQTWPAMRVDVVLEDEKAAPGAAGRESEVPASG
ncbi:hypothetical protein F4780DRAFT_773768 [Xylariomycetidae sp. FL0641]|nr:hypothetical protein F4780DRAFT_773768 [Xylariomycetidae sp. FL0641]